MYVAHNLPFLLIFFLYPFYTLLILALLNKRLLFVNLYIQQLQNLKPRNLEIP